MSSTALSKKAVHADSDFAAIYHEHADAVYRWLTRLVGAVAEREDLLQDVFLRLHRSLPNYRGESTLSTFLYRIVVRVAYTHLKAHKHAIVEVDLDQLAFPGASPEQLAQRRQRAALVLRCMTRLKPSKRIAFVLREVMGLTYAEIGELVNAREATVRQRANHAKRELERMMRRQS